MNRKILLIGGAGYVGGVLAGQLLDSGYSVKVLDNLIYQNTVGALPYINNLNYEFIFGSMNDGVKLEKALDGVTDVVLLAGLVGDPITKKYPKLSEVYNDIAVKSVIDAIAAKNEIKRLVFISTCSNYGLIADDQLAHEEFNLNPLSLYAKSKVSAENYIQGLKSRSHISPTILRFATAFGVSPRMRFDLSVSEFTREILSGKELLVFDADTWRPYCHLLDFSRLIIKVLEAPDEKIRYQIFNAGGDINNYTKRMIVDEILRHIPGGKVRYQEHGSDPRNYRVDFSKVKKQLQFEPKFSISHGISELINALNNHLFDEPKEINPNIYGNYVLENL